MGVKNGRMLARQSRNCGGMIFLASERILRDQVLADQGRRHGMVVLVPGLVNAHIAHVLARSPTRYQMKL